MLPASFSFHHVSEVSFVRAQKVLRVAKLRKGLCINHGCNEPHAPDRARCKRHLEECRVYQRELMRKRRREEKAKTFGPFVWVG